MVFSIVVAIVLLAGTNANGVDVNVTSNLGTFSIDGNFPSSSPFATCALPLVCSGTGTNTIVWGTPGPGLSTGSVLLETNTSVPNVHVGDAAQPADKFAIGSLTFTNSTTEPGTAIDHVFLQISLKSVTDVLTGNPDSHGNEPPIILNLLITNTTNITSDPVASRDSITITNSLFRDPLTQVQFNTFSVDEGKDNTVDIVYQFGSLDLIGFANVRNPETGSLSFVAIPEPSSLLLLGSGLVTLVLACWKKGLSRPDTGSRW